MVNIFTLIEPNNLAWSNNEIYRNIINYYSHKNNNNVSNGDPRCVSKGGSKRKYIITLDNFSKFF